MIFTDFKKRLLTALALLFLLFIIFVNDIALLYTILVFGTLSIIEFFNLNQKITKNKFIKLIFNTAFIMFVFLFCTTFFLFSNFIQLKIIFFIILIGCIASDLGGYIIGKIFKGPKLTSISPNKTISGAFGSIIFSIIIINVLIFYYVEIINIKTIFIGAISSIGCQSGDLFFSYLKRKAKLKDTGNFLPGHGGVLDRLDGIFFGLPIGLLSFVLIY